MTDAHAGRTAKQREIGVGETQLELWSQAEPLRAVSDTLGFVREALAKRYWPEKASFEVYLQGAHATGTSVPPDGDVDVVVELTSTFLHDISLLSAQEQAQFRQFHHQSVYGWGEFKAETLEALASYFGRGAVEVRPRTLRVHAPGMLPANVLVSVRHRRYVKFRNIADQGYAEGITFYDPSSSRWVVSYPRQHAANARRKDEATDGWFSRAVRATKQMRALLIDLDTIPAELAPPWFVESLLYNVPDTEFGVRHRHTIVKALRYLKEVDLTGFVRQDEQGPLFGSALDQWSYRDATRFVDELIRLWWNWR